MNPVEDYRYVMDILATGDVRQWEELGMVIEGFPCGKDPFVNRHWITNAIDCGSADAVAWMIGKGADLNFQDEEGVPPLHSALYRKGEARYAILKMLLEGGASANQKGHNDWTPLHLAAVLDDVKACEILVGHGADPSVRTEIDNYATPLEEAKILGKAKDTIQYLESLE